MVLKVVGNEELVKQEEALIKQQLAERQNQPIILGLADHLRTCWDAARQAKKPIENLMLKALRQRNGEYEADKLNQINSQGGSDVYMMITEVKCRAAESWLRDILLDQGSPPWGLETTPIPDLSPQQTAEIENAFAEQVVKLVEVNGQAPTQEEMLELKEMVTQNYRFKLLQGADNRAKKMEIKIRDQFTQGGWGESFNEFITDLVTYPCAFVKGPVVRRQRKLGWKYEER